MDIQTKSATKTSIVIFLIFALFFTNLSMLVAQTNSSKVTFKGIVLDNTSKTPIDGASVLLPQYSLWAITEKDGSFSIDNVPVGENEIVIRMIGHVTIEQKILVSSNAKVITFHMDQNNLRLKDVEVSARMKKEGITPITSISRSAMDHIQATSLSDVLNLLPGAVPVNQSLAKVSTATLNNFYGEDTYGIKRNVPASVQNSLAMSSMGTSIIVDNAPISNNSNLQMLSKATGQVPAFESTVGTGVDLRQISTDNIESVDVIRGIASVQYGDATSGAVIVRSKAGKAPVSVRFKVNPNITQASASTGYNLGEKKGSLNLSLDYANSLNKESEANKKYNRYTAKVLYSNTFFKKLRTNFSLDFIYGKDNNKQDAEELKKADISHSKSQTVRFNANGSYLFNTDFLKSIQYVVSASYVNQNSYYHTVRSGAENIFSTAMDDNTIVGNAPSLIINDKDGNVLTQWTERDREAYAFATTNAYATAYNVYGKEWNVFSSLKANFAKDFGISKHKFIVGGDFKTDGNTGRGTVFNLQTPPTAKGVRPRSYKDIPFIQQYGVYAEENLTLDIAEHTLEVQVGVRMDKQKDLKAEVTPRINASFEILKNKLYVRGGYGEMVKSAPLLYIYPENAYFDILNYTDKTTNPTNPQYLMTTRVLGIQNENLKLAKNKKYEVGADFFFGRNSLNVTLFKEKMTNGYSYVSNYSPTAYDKYINGPSGLELDNENSKDVFLAFNSPANTLGMESKGFDFNLNIARIDAIRTSFVLSGGYTESKIYDTAESYYIKNDDINSNYIGVYEAKNTINKRTRFATNLRLIHNIPEIGFIISLSAVTTWVDKARDIIGNDSIPIAYFDKSLDRHSFDPSMQNDKEFSAIMKSLSNDRALEDKAPILWCFNLHLTKEIGQNFSVSFFANNLFSSNPRYRLRSASNYYTLNPKTFFGVELSAKIPW